MGEHESPEKGQPGTSEKSNMALPTGSVPVSGFNTPAEAKYEERSSDLLLHALFRLLPAPTMPRLTDKVLMQTHLEEVNALLTESSLMSEHGFTAGCEQRCRAAIKDSFSNFPDIARQVSLWFSRGIDWGQIQSDLVKTFASSRDVALAYSASLASLAYGPTFVIECRDLFVVYQSVFYEHPHRLIDFVERVCTKLQGDQRKRVISKLIGEASDEYWQTARPFWEGGSSHTVLGLIEEVIRVDTAVRDFNQSHGLTKLAQSSGATNDKVRQVSEAPTPRPESPSAPNWLMPWVSQYPSVWVVEPRTSTPDVDKLVTDLRSKAVDSKGPLRRKSTVYHLLAFKDAITAKNVLSSSLGEKDFRPFALNRQKNA